MITPKDLPKTQLHKRNAFGGILYYGVLLTMIGAVLLVVGLFTTATLENSLDSAITPEGASDTLTFSGNVSANETVNFTISGVLYIFAFNHNDTNGDGTWPNNKTVCCIANTVNLSDFQNSSVYAATNLSNAINNNVSLAALITATSSGSVVTVTADSTVYETNYYTAAENVLNAVWASTSFTGAVPGMTSYTKVKGNLNTAMELMGIVLIISGIGLIVTTLLRGFGRKSRR